MIAIEYVLDQICGIINNETVFIIIYFIVIYIDII